MHCGDCSNMSENLATTPVLGHDDYYAVCIRQWFNDASYCQVESTLGSVSYRDG